MKFPGIKESRMLDCKNAKIAESYYHGAEYTREMITHEIARLQRLFPSKEFRVSIPYTRPISGNRFGSSDSVHLYSLTDTYDDSQMPDDGSLEPESFDRFWVYINKPIVLTGGCNPKQDSGLNDCLYNCLKMALGTKWKLSQGIKTPELLKKRL